jgi:hypothetical protein
MKNSNQQIHEGIQSIIHEETKPVYDSYASEGSVEDEYQPLDSHDDNVVLNNVVQEAYEKVADAFDKTSDLPMNYALINEAEIIEKQYGFLCQLDMKYHWKDHVALYMSSCIQRFKILQRLELKQIVVVSMGCPFIFCCKNISFSTFSYLPARKKTLLEVKSFHGCIGNLPTHYQHDFNRKVE